MPMEAYWASEVRFGLGDVQREKFALVQSTRGCPHTCFFCTSPLLSGYKAYRKRSVDNVVAEINWLKDTYGVEEIQFMDDNFFVSVPRVKELCNRLIEEFPDLIFSAPGGAELPVQSGSDRVLNAMNRRHSATDYLRLIDRLRLARPDLAVSSDFIVGFPGEEESDFQDTLKLVERIKFVGAYSFKYSPRPGTPAARMTCQVEEQIKKRRLAELQSLLNAQQLAFNEECVGKHLDVLLDNRGRYEGQLIGRSPYMQAVHVNAPANLIGSIEKLRIDRANPNSLGATRLVNDGFERVVV